jgi:hypothetical protein
MAQPNQASQNQDPMSRLDELERSAEPADRTNAQGANSPQSGSPKPDTTAVVTQVNRQDNVQVNADSTPQSQNTDQGDSATDPNTAPAPTGADAGTSDQPGESGSTDTPSDGNQKNESGNDNDTSANNGVTPPNYSDRHGLELSINEIPNFDAFCTRCELANIIDKAIQSATESNNSRELLILKRIKTYYLNVLNISSICKLILQFQLGVELPVILQKLKQGVRK